ncbi:hypothetical protein [Lacipirellula limnantheis]|nr:hypothetical protein [Lacipirellula limnantheis]
MTGTIPDEAMKNQAGLESCVNGGVWGVVEVIVCARGFGLVA